MEIQISIITPVYQGVGFIESCLQSVLAQNCPYAEHIVVDGGSTDGTLDVLRAYSFRCSRLVWISEKDRGQSDALNKGVHMARGRILGSLNVDDYYEPNVLNRVLQLFQELAEPALLVGNCNIWSAEGRLLKVNRPDRLGLTDLLLGPELCPFPVNPSAYFYHASLHREIGLFDVEERYAMDLDFLLRAAARANVRYVDETWGNFRYLPGTKTYEDCKKRLNGPRVDRLLARHRSRLSFPRQLQVAFKERMLTATKVWKTAAKRKVKSVLRWTG